MSALYDERQEGQKLGPDITDRQRQLCSALCEIEKTKVSGWFNHPKDQLRELLWPATISEMTDALRECKEKGRGLVQRLQGATCRAGGSEAEIESYLDDSDASLGKANAILQAIKNGFAHVARHYNLIANLIFDLKGTIRIFLRIAPRNSTGQPRHPIEIQSHSWGALHESGTSVLGKASQKTRKYRFDRIFGPGQPQEDLINAVLPLTRKFVAGKAVCIFCYGLTNSGKTSTTFGPSGSSQGGLLHAILNKLFLDTDRAA